MVLIPISFTVPLHPSITTISPTRYSPSITINKPATTSATSDCAPRPITNVKTPALANKVDVFTPQVERIAKAAIMTIIHLKKLCNNLKIVIPLFVFAKHFVNIHLSSLFKK